MIKSVGITHVFLSVQIVDAKNTNTIDIHIEQLTQNFINLAFQKSSSNLLRSTLNPSETLRKEEKLRRELGKTMGEKIKYLSSVTEGVFIRKSEDEEWPNIIFRALIVISNVLDSNCHLSGTIEI
jgi:hypothetical protein